jgi:hypothetical protein
MSHHGFIAWLSRTTKDFSAAESGALLAHAKATVARGDAAGCIEPSVGRVGEHAAKFDRLYAEGNVGACDVMKDWLIAEIDQAIEDC